MAVYPPPRMEQLPHITSLRSRNGKGNEALCRNGVYYVVGPKRGQIFAEVYTHGRQVKAGQVGHGFLFKKQNRACGQTKVS